MNNNIYVNYLGFDDDSTNAEMSAPSADDMPNKDSVIIHSDDGSDVLATTETKIDSFWNLLYIWAMILCLSHMMKKQL